MTDDTNHTPEHDPQSPPSPESAATNQELERDDGSVAVSESQEEDTDESDGGSGDEAEQGGDTAQTIDELVAGLRGADDLPSPGGDDVEVGDGVELVESLPIDPDDDLSEVEGEASARLVSIVESLLFAANRPLKVRELRRVLGSEPTKRQIQLALKKLEEDTAGRGVVLRQVAGGFVLRTNPDNARYVQKLLQSRPVRLSRPQLETLAVIVYRQPITRAEIDHVRGVDSGAVLKLLLERDLIKIVGRKEEPGRPMLYGTTVKFLEFFELKSLRDLPDLREFTELSEQSKERLSKTMDDDELEAFGQEVLDFARAEGSESSETAGDGGAEMDSEDGDEHNPTSPVEDGDADPEQASVEETDAASEDDATEAEMVETDTDTADAAAVKDDASSGDDDDEGA